MSTLMQDPDTFLFPSLIAGVGTGFQHDIPLSHCFPPNAKDDGDAPPLSAHLTNWQSADDDIGLTKDLVQQELDKRWVFAFNGTLEDAQQQYPLGVALGKLGVAHPEGRAPRLVLDNSVCGLNERCKIPERSTLPSAKDVLRTFPIRNFSGGHMGFSLDIKAAHERIVVRESEHGLLRFTLQALFLPGGPLWCHLFNSLVVSAGGLFAPFLPFPHLVGLYWSSVR
eukprot:s3615_g4.t1